MMTFNKWLNSANIFWRGRFVIIFINGLTSPYIYPFPDVAVGSSQGGGFLSYPPREGRMLPVFKLNKTTLDKNKVCTSLL